jgi:DNA-binding transcriptional LysR family regulator
VLGEEYPGTAQPLVAGARTQLLSLDELFLVIPACGPHAWAGSPGPVDLAELARVPWSLDPASTATGEWARNACRAAGFEPDVRYCGSDLLLQLHLAETGHAAAVLPGLLLAAVPPPAAHVRPMPGRPHRKLTTGVRAGAASDPAVVAFRAALAEAVTAVTAVNAVNAACPFPAPGQPGDP